MAWVYYQKTGKLEYKGHHIATGYSGAPGHKNDPSSESKKDLGPIPRGVYSLHSPINSPRTGPYAIPLSPIGHSAHGRTHFQIHGDSRRNPGTASSGCIILPRSVREKIWKSGVKTIEVRK